MAPRLSPSSRTSAVTIPRQLAPTVELAHGGVEFLEGSLSGFREVRNLLDEEKPIVGRIYINVEFTRSKSEIFIDDVHQFVWQDDPRRSRRVKVSV